MLKNGEQLLIEENYNFEWIICLVDGY